MFRLTINGTIPVKKNRQRIGRNGGIYKPKEVTEYEELFGWEARLKRLEMVPGKFAISGTFRVKKTKDLDGCLTTILDCLQKHGLIENDKYLAMIHDLEKIDLQPGEEESVTIQVTPA